MHLCVILYGEGHNCHFGSSDEPVHKLLGWSKNDLRVTLAKPTLLPLLPRFLPSLLHPLNQQKAGVIT